MSSGLPGGPGAHAPLLTCGFWVRSGVRDAVNRLRAHVDRLSGDNARVAVPSVDGGPWCFDTRRFRRTPAWSIGAQPFGVWRERRSSNNRNVRSATEGIGPAVFEGYVGTSPSGFPAEVELAKQASVDLYVESWPPPMPAALLAPLGSTPTSKICAKSSPISAPPSDHRFKWAPPPTLRSSAAANRNAAGTPVSARNPSGLGGPLRPGPGRSGIRDLPTLQRQHLAQQRDRLKSGPSTGQTTAQPTTMMAADRDRQRPQRPAAAGGDGPHPGRHA